MNGDKTEQGGDQSTAVNQPPVSGDRVLIAPILSFDLTRELEQLRHRESYTAGNPTGKTLVKERDLRIVLMALRAGGRLEEHQASGALSIQGIEGRFRLHLSAESTELTAGGLLVLEPGIRHDILAIEDTAFLLTIGRTTYQHVSDRHEPRA